MPDIFLADKREKEEEEDPTKRPIHHRQSHTYQQPAHPPAELHTPAAEQHIPKEKHPKAVSRSTSLPDSDTTTVPGLFSSYCPNPVGMEFKNKEGDEDIVLFLRRHFLTNIPWLFVTGIMLLLPPLYFIILRAVDFIFFPVPPQMTFVLVCFYYIVVLSYAFGKFIVWYYHVGIITEKRLLDLDVDNVFHYHLAETEMRDIVDVSYTQKGFFQSFFHFGNVHIQTQAIKANFEFEETPWPARVSDIITDLRPQHGAKKGEAHGT